MCPVDRAVNLDSDRSNLMLNVGKKTYLPYESNVGPYQPMNLQSDKNEGVL